jgi:hypothetical protein
LPGLLPVEAHAVALLPAMSTVAAWTDDGEETPDEEAEEEPLPEPAGKHDQRQHDQPYKDHRPTSCSLGMPWSDHTHTTLDSADLLAT